MHNNYYFLKQLSHSLETKIKGMELATCFSQSKDEMVLGFCSNTEEFYIRASLSSELSYLAFPDEFHRAKKNSVDLLPDLIGMHVQDVIQQWNERSFYILFDSGWKLLFKMHGNRSNIIVFNQEDEVSSIFNNRLQNDLQINIRHLDRPLLQDKDEFLKVQGDLKKLFPTFGPLPLAYLSEKGYDTAPIEKQWEMLTELIATLDNPKLYFIIKFEATVRLSLLNIGEIISQTPDPIEAANKFAQYYSKTFYLEKEKHNALTALQKKKTRTENYILKSLEKLDDLKKNSRYEEIANILMANLYQIPAGSEKVELYDFYRDIPITIKLKRDISPQKNAENLYRKAKNQKLELDNLQHNITNKEEELQKIEQQIKELQESNNVKDVRKHVKAGGLDKDDKELLHLPFKKFEWEGFDILVGKSAASNDELTQKYSFKEDLWLHARDVSGSHVLIKHKAGKVFPNSVIEKAAQLAAYYSKRKNDTLCPVIYTPKKFVRKVKGSLPGQVVVDKENVIMVEPKPY